MVPAYFFTFQGSEINDLFPKARVYRQEATTLCSRDLRLISINVSGLKSFINHRSGLLMSCLTLATVIYCLFRCLIMLLLTFLVLLLITVLSTNTKKKKCADFFMKELRNGLK